MLRRSSPASGANAGSAGIAERMAEAAAAVRGDCAAAAKWWRMAALVGDADGRAMPGVAHRLGAGVEREPVAAPAGLTRACATRNGPADRLCIGVRDACSLEQRREAERRASLPLGLEEGAP
jgi:hypothetical protein